MGKAQEGVLTADSKDAVIATLRRQQVMVSGVTEKGKEFALPKLGGRAVYEQIRERHPETRVLFSSGYSMDAIDTNFVLDEGMRLIQKPYRRNDLLRKIREVLDA